MHDNRRESAMDDMQKDAEMRKIARRRLIKGGFAVPAALTLCSGSALAASSSGCINASAAAGQAPGPNSGTTWVRLQAYKLTYSPSGKTSEWIHYSQVAGLLGSSTGAVNIVDGVGVPLISGTALCVHVANGVPGVVKNRVSNPPSGMILNGRFYAVLVNGSGDIVGISSVSNVSGGAVSNACWHSLGGLSA